MPVTSDAQNLGQQPPTDQAVPGQTAAQPEGAVLNLVNWLGNVIAPVGAALAAVLAVVEYSQGRGVTVGDTWLRNLVAAMCSFGLSGLLRLGDRGSTFSSSHPIDRDFQQLPSQNYN